MADDSASFLATVLEDLLQGLGRATDSEEIVAERAAFDERRGRVHEEDDLWEARTRAFLDWYAIERPDPSTGISPVSRAREASTDPRRKAALTAWERSYRCIAEVVELGSRVVSFVDLIGGAHISVDERRGLPGVSPGDIAELRVLAFEGRIHFGSAFLWHPAGTRGPLMDRIAAMSAAGASREQIADFAAKLYVRSLRYGHLPPSKVYQDANA